MKQVRATLSQPVGLTEPIPCAMVKCFRCQKLGHYASECVVPVPVPRINAVGEEIPEVLEN